jgi:phytoene synthase
MVRDAVATAFAWRAELEHIVRKANDPGAARLKLDWWREELSGVQQGTARHPLSAALSSLLADARHLQLLLTMLDGIENDIRKIQPDDQQEFYVQCDLIGGSFGELLSALATPDDLSGTNGARSLGCYDEAVTRICNLAKHLRREFCPLPHLAHDGTKTSLATLKSAPGQSRLPQIIAQLLGQKSHQVGTILAIDSRAKRISPAHRLAAQAQVLNAKMARHNYAVLNRQWELLPIRRLWAAWRLQ